MTSHTDYYIPLNPDRYERETFKNYGGAVLSKIEISKVSELLDASDGSTILDVGIGTGRLLRSLAEKDITFVGLDRNRRMIRHLIRKINGKKVSAFERSHLIVADGQNLPFRSNVFDAVICIRVLKYFKLPQKGIADISSVLKPEGKFILEFSNIFGISGLSQLPQHFLKGNFFPRLFRLREIQSWIVSSSMGITEKSPLHKIPPKFWTLAQGYLLARVFASAEAILIRITPIELLSKSIILSAVKSSDTMGQEWLG